MVIFAVCILQRLLTHITALGQLLVTSKGLGNRVLGGKLLGTIQGSGGNSLDLVIGGGQGAQSDDKVLADLAG